ncbi:MAG TPA: GGDEF domain-containing phosphodiesterase [Chloroflexota bacterium]|nr:GGDEF domain-containing phosphodiesterase [Chloroflexota bacterium]
MLQSNWDRPLIERVERCSGDSDRDWGRWWGQTEDLACVVDEEGRIRVATPGCAAVLGGTATGGRGVSLFSVAHPDDVGVIMAALWEIRLAGRPVVTRCRLFLRTPRGEGCDLVMQPYGSGRECSWVMVWLHRGTGGKPPGSEAVLPHPGWLGECAVRVGALARRVRATGGSLAVVVADASGLASLATAMGVEEGDDALYAVGRRLGDGLLEPPLLEWLGRDRVLLCLPHMTAGAAREVVLDACEGLLDRATGGESPRFGSLGLGVASVPEHGDDWLGVVWAADLALDVARAAGGGCVVASGAQEGTPSPRGLAGDLAEGLRLGQFRVYYQPIVGAGGDGGRRVEALARWLHPRHGLLSPGLFIGLAEQTGLITPLTLWILEAALVQIRAWAQAGQVIGVAVNLSMESLRDPLFAQGARELLDKFAVAPGQLTLEVTESALMSRPQEACALLDQLVSAGARVAIDDFGVGYSSLQYLHRLPVQEIKIDRSFLVEGFLGGDSALLGAIIHLGGALGLSVVIEGVEDQRMSDWLGPLEGGGGTILRQGYLYGRPMLADQVAALC